MIAEHKEIVVALQRLIEPKSEGLLAYVRFHRKPDGVRPPAQHPKAALPGPKVKAA
jgi:hypothetical protein